MKSCNTTFLALMVILGTASNAQAQKVGDYVVVISNYRTKIYDKTVDNVYTGGVYRLKAINQTWWSVDNVRGWFPSRMALDLKNGEQHYTRLIQSNSRNDNAWAARGWIRYHRNQYKEAFSDLNQALKIAKTNPRHWTTRGAIALAMGDDQQAEIDLAYALRLDPKHTTARYNLGLAFYNQGKLDLALQRLNEVLKSQPDRVDAMITRGSVHNDLGNRSKALADYEKAIKISPTSLMAYLGKSVVLLDMEKYEEAETAANQAIKIDSGSAAALNNRGWIRQKLGKYDKAIADYDRALRADSQFSAALSNRGVARFSKKQYQEALEDFERALQIEPDSAPVFVNRGMVFHELTQYSNAIRDYSKAMKLEPGSIDATTQLAWILATCPDENLRDGKQARKILEPIFGKTKSPGWHLHDVMGAIFAELGEFEKAEQHARSALRQVSGKQKQQLQSRLELYENNESFSIQVAETSLIIESAQADQFVAAVPVQFSGSHQGGFQHWRWLAKTLDGTSAVEG